MFYDKVDISLKLEWRTTLVHVVCLGLASARRTNAEKKPMMTNRQVQFCSLSITCFTIDNNNVISSSLRRIICPIHLNVSFAAGGCSSWIIATFASNTNVQNTSCKNRKSMNFWLGWSSSHKYRITVQFHTSSQTSAEINWRIALGGNYSAKSTRRK